MPRIARTSNLILSVIILAGSIYAVMQRQRIFDYLALRNYSPNARVIALADQTTMQEPTRRVFYINHPELNDKPAFRRNCPTTEASIVLGCYVERQGIYLLDINDQRLDGVVPVTAAHEVLHAQYERLSSDERRRIDTLTTAFYEGLDNARIKKTVENYRQRDAGVVPNELHSILATEVRDLSPELEEYYSRYFKDRGQLVGLSERYEQAFVSLDNQRERYDGQLRELKTVIEAGQLELQAQNDDIERRKAQLDRLLDSGQTEEYNQQVPVYNAEVNRLNQAIIGLRAQIASYNDIVEKRNQATLTEQELVEAINSNAVNTRQPE